MTSSNSNNAFFGGPESMSDQNGEEGFGLSQSTSIINFQPDPSSEVPREKSETNDMVSSSGFFNGDELKT